MKHAILVAALLLTGCNTVPETKVEVQTVYVAVYTPPEIKEVPKPVLPIETLTADSSPSAVADAYASTVEVLKGYAQSLVEIIDSIKVAK